ncbi:MAG TPA: DNA repair protein RadA [Acidimicrobiales bacterium]|nr:DNA repair protein RadA [Acidimicrobiales bacterium]
MAKLRTVHRCQECGAAAPRWAGRCPACGAWNTLVEEVDRPAPSSALAAGYRLAGAAAVPIAEVVADGCRRRPTGVAELDRVLGGGLLPGSVTLVGGEPGIGKSTLLLQVLAGAAAAGGRCLLVSAEESAEQVRVRAERLGAAQAGGLWLVSETELSHLVSQVEEVAPTHLVVDSIQTVFDAALDSAPGSVAQVRHCTSRLVRLAKERRAATVLVGHVTKDGSLAGPRVLEHAVDTVLSFEGDRHHGLRLVRAVKHRFGPVGELGLFEMGPTGLVGVPDAAGLFLADRQPGVAGSAVVAAMDGCRPLLVEVQALVVSAKAAFPRRSAEGVDAGRLDLLLAVLEKRAGLDVGRSDVYALAAGGVRVVEPAADLALSLAVASAHSGVPLPGDLVACGEIGLGGELRQVPQVERRLAEAARLGFGRAVLPAGSPEPPPGVTALRAGTLAEAVTVLGLRGAMRSSGGRGGETVLAS